MRNSPAAPLIAARTCHQSSTTSSPLKGTLLTLAFVFITEVGEAYASHAFPGGDGTLASPWQIETAEQLNWIRDHLDAHFVLTASIDLGGNDAGGLFWNGGDGWEPMGPFEGSLDGQGFAITGLFIDRDPVQQIGLFSVINNGASVRNVHLEGVAITGDKWVGGLAALNEGEISGSYVSGTIFGDDNTGGLVGANDGSIVNSHATVNVEADDWVGGLVGTNRGEISSSYATGDVSGDYIVGGLVGYHDSGVITNSYATGAVSGANIGGLVGYSNASVISNSYATGGLVGSHMDGAITGSFWDTDATALATSSAGTGKSTSEMQDAATFTLAGWDFGSPGVWAIHPALNSGYPYLQWQNLMPPAPPEPPRVTTPVLRGHFIDQDLIGPLRLGPGSTIRGGSLSGAITNSGEISDLRLLPGTTIKGGVVSGVITGGASGPAELTNATVPEGSYLENVVIGGGTVLDPRVILGPNVRFTFHARIPSGMDLTGALGTLPWSVGDGRNVVDLAYTLAAPTGAGLIRALQLLESFEPSGNRLEQDGDGQLRVATADSLTVLLPQRVSQAAADDEAGSYVNEDGDIVFITAGGQAVLTYAVPAGIPSLERELSLRGLTLSYDERANVVVRQANGEGYFVARPGPALPAAADAEEGLWLRTPDIPAGSITHSLIFRDAEGRLMEQYLQPTPTDWPAVKEALWAIPGVTAVRLDEQGFISVVAKGRLIRGMTDALVQTGDESATAGGISLRWVEDLNGDGTTDYLVIHPNGERQALYILPE